MKYELLEKADNYSNALRIIRRYSNKYKKYDIYFISDGVAIYFYD